MSLNHKKLFSSMFFLLLNIEGKGKVHINAYNQSFYKLFNHL